IVLEPKPSVAPLVIEFESADPAGVPALVEVRQSNPAVSSIAAVDRTTGRATFPALPRISYAVFAFVQGIGTWQAGHVVADANRDQIVRFRVPRPMRISGELVLPGGCSPRQVRAWVYVTSFNALGFEGAGRCKSARE